jgi:CdiI N-terminal domain
MFRIAFLPDQEPAPLQARYGVIRVGDYEERFLSSLEVWNSRDYEEQWVAALRRIASREKESALITSIRDPGRSSGVAWWPLYRVGDIIFVQNAIRFFAHLEVPFDVDNPYASIPPRRAVTLAGEPISEWQVSLDEVQQFLKVRKF